MLDILTHNILQIHAQAGQRWLEQLPAQIKDLQKRYALSDLRPITPLTYHYVFAAQSPQGAVVLKLGPDIADLQREAQALQIFSGHGAMPLLAEEQGVLMLQRALPGNTLASLAFHQEELALAYFCHTMKRLHQAPPPSGLETFPQMNAWLAHLDHDWAIPPRDLILARRLRDRLQADRPTSVLLHGDLHHDNLLQHGTTYQAIDPKGVWGDPRHELFAFIRNPIPQVLAYEQAHILVYQRIHGLAKTLQYNPHTLTKWCFVQNILSWTWDLADRLDPSHAQQFSKILRKLLPSSAEDL